MFKAVSKIKVKVELKPIVENLVFRLHYRYTYTIFMVGVVLTTIYDLIGKKINCMPGIPSASFQKVVNSYCFIMGTFTVDSQHNQQSGAEVPHPGVAPMIPNEPVTYHTYYQWVPFVLFFQGVMFYIPHWLWKGFENGLFRVIIQDLSLRDYLGSDLRSYYGRQDRFLALSKYINGHKESCKSWAYKFFLCEFLNLVVVVGMLFFTDWFLGGEFLTYGTKVFEIIRLDPENRTDPMSYIFPKMAKCVFKSFGPSGTIQVRDVLCLIATNIINEKIYLFLWVWLILLTSITSAWLIYRILTIILPPLRLFLLQKRVNEKTRSEVKTLMSDATLSHWFLLYSLANNMERSVFSEFIHELVTSDDPDEYDNTPLMIPKKDGEKS